MQFLHRCSDKPDQPQPIPQNFVSCKSIGGNAHENWTLLYIIKVQDGKLQVGFPEVTKHY